MTLHLEQCHQNWLTMMAGSANFEDITKNDSKPNEAGLSRNGKTISLVDLTLLPAADDFMMLS